MHKAVVHAALGTDEASQAVSAIEDVSSDRHAAVLIKLEDLLLVGRQVRVQACTSRLRGQHDAFYHGYLVTPAMSRFFVYSSSVFSSMRIITFVQKYLLCMGFQHFSDIRRLFSLIPTPFIYDQKK